MLRFSIATFFPGIFSAALLSAKKSPGNEVDSIGNHWIQKSSTRWTPRVQLPWADRRLESPLVIATWHVTRQLGLFISIICFVFKEKFKVKPKHARPKHFLDAWPHPGNVVLPSCCATSLSIARPNKIPICDVAEQRFWKKRLFKIADPIGSMQLLSAGVLRRCFLYSVFNAPPTHRTILQLQSTPHTNVPVVAGF